MRKLTLLSGALLVTVLALAGGFSNPGPAWAICYCPSNNEYTTRDDWAQGANCEEAYNNLVAQLNQHAYAHCGGSTQTCLGEIVLSGGYWWCWSPYPGVYQAGGYRYYSCKECTDSGPGPGPREPV